MTHPHPTPLGPGREFDLIRDLLARWNDRAAGVGDDAATLPVPSDTRLVVSTDSSVENVHFRREWLSAREIGYRATASALSDLAAMAAAPLGVLVALSLPEGWLGEISALADGIGDAVAFAGTRIVGGDLTSGRDLALTVTVLGAAAKPLRRDGAREGDLVYVTGTFGGPGAALRALQAGRTPSAEARARFAHPVPRIPEARWLARHGVHSALDVSDGLLGDVGHLAAASRVRIVLDLDELPTLSGMSPLDAARSGEEYELALASGPLDTAAFAREFGIPLTPVGRVVAGPVGVEAMSRGERVASLAGFSHFF